MSIRYRDNVFKMSLLLILLATSLYARHPLDGTFNGEKLNSYEYETQGDSYLMSCNWEHNETKMPDINQVALLAISALADVKVTAEDSIEDVINKVIEKKMPVDGICKNLNYETVLAGKAINNTTTSKIQKIINLIIKIINLYYATIDTYYIPRPSVGTIDQDYNYTMDGNITFVGEEKVGSSFDLGAFAKCEIKQEKIEEMLISKFCAGEDNGTFSPAAVLTANTVDAMGLPSYSGKDGDKNNTIKKVADRDYPAKDMTGEKLYGDKNGSNGGFLIEEAKDDPYGSTATALNSFDKPTLVLKDLALKNFGTSDINVTTLPATKAQSMDLEDEIVKLQTRMDADLYQFGDTLTRALRKELLDKTSIKAHNWMKGKDPLPHLASQAAYEMREKNTTEKFFQSKTSGLAAIYKGIEDDAKAKMASEELVMTTDPNYITDPSEARAALIKPAQRNKFRYAALIQQEKNKQLKLKYAKEIKRKQQMVDIIKQQAYIRASLFRDEIAKHMLKHLLDKVDESQHL